LLVDLGGRTLLPPIHDPKVAGLVYVTALAPDAGESTGDQFAEIPAPPGFVIEPQSDGFGFVSLAKFKAGFATRIGAEAVEIKGSHVVFLSRPEAVAGVIDKAAKTATSKAK
jgi:hypothetical protein